MTASDDMLSWLKATIEGDKAAAEALPHGPWHVEMSERRYPQRISNAAAILIAETYTGPQVSPGIANYIVLHDPRDTIARCEAELALLALHDDLHDCPTTMSSQVFPAGDRDEIPCPVVRLLVLARRHRPGFNPEWVEG